MFRTPLSKIVLLSAALTLAACGSRVKLSDVPVEDRSGAAAAPAAASPAVSPLPESGSAVGPASRNVAPVALAPADAAGAGPAGIGRVIYFDYDSFVIKPEFQAVIDGHARFLNANKSRRISIEGHTDERGGREYNLALGQKRAEAVRRALSLLGVTEAQVEPVSFGEEKPLSTGASEDAFAKNRRAEINYR